VQSLTVFTAWMVFFTFRRMGSAEQEVIIENIQPLVPDNEVTAAVFDNREDKKHIEYEGIVPLLLPVDSIMTSKTVDVNSILFQLTLLVGRQEGYLACKKLSGGCWHGYLSGASKH